MIYGISMNAHNLTKVLQNNLPQSVEVLRELITYPSTRRNEKQISQFLKDIIEDNTDQTELMIIPQNLMEDPDYSFKIQDFHYSGEANVRGKLQGKSDGRKLAFNTHFDVVPASEGQKNPFSPTTRKNFVYGRGAIDCKGQIATLWLVLKTLKDLQLHPAGDLLFDFVIEEECGGNGSLYIVRNGLEADGAVVMEPTELQVVNLVRGAVWFEVEIWGKGGHSGSSGYTASALQEAINVMEAIKKVREKLLYISRKKINQIADHPDPMPCTFGMLHSGNWPASKPSKAILKGVFGFLPPYKRREVQDELTKAVSSYQAEIKFNMLNNDPSYIKEDHPIVQTFINATQEAGIFSKPKFMNASCDAWRYSEQLHIPTVVFGLGSINIAHSKDEHVDIFEIPKAALALIHFIDKWSGLNHD